MNVILHIPETPGEKEKLTECAARVHAEAISDYIKHLNCPCEQKLELLHTLSFRSAPVQRA